MPSKESIERMIADIDDAIDESRIELNSWEAKFFPSIKEQLKSKGSLTEGQYLKLEEIWNKV